MNEIILPYVTIRYKAPIIYLTFKQGSELGFPEMRELVYCAEKLTNKNNYLVLSDVREGVKVTQEGKKYSLLAINAPYHKGTAVLVNNSAYSLAVTLFIGLKAPEFPYKAFINESNATEWLLNLDLESKIGSK
jgi:hypothetical protein